MRSKFQRFTGLRTDGLRPTGTRTTGTRPSGTRPNGIRPASTRTDGLTPSLAPAPGTVVFSWLGLGLIIIPLIFLAALSFSASGSSTLLALFTSAAGHELIINTLILALCVGTVSTLLGAAAALAQNSQALPGKRFWHLGLILPALLPPFVLPALLFSSLGRSGKIFSTYFAWGLDLYGFFGVALCQTILFTPTAYLVILATIRSIKPQLLESYTTLGIPPGGILATLLRPALLPAALRAFLLVLGESSADLATPLVLGADFRVLSVTAYNEAVTSADLGPAGAYALVLLTMSFLVIVFARTLVGPLTLRPGVTSQLFTPSSPDSQLRLPRSLAVLLGSLSAVLSLTGWVFAVALALCSSAAVLTRPISTAVLKTATPADQVSSLRQVLLETPQIPLSAMLNSFFLSSCALPLILVLSFGFVTCFHPDSPHFITRIAGKASRILVQLPGSVTGLALLCTFASPWEIAGFRVFPALVGSAAWGGGGVVIVLAYVLRSLGLAVGELEASYRTLNPSWWEAGAALGIAPGSLRRQVLLPLLRPSLLTAAGAAFATSLSSLSTVAFLPSANWEVLTISMLSQMDGSRYDLLFFTGGLLFLLIISIEAAFFCLTPKNAVFRKEPRL